MFVTKLAFDPALTGKAIYVTTKQANDNIEGVYLVEKATDSCLFVNGVGSQTIEIYIEQFTKGLGEIEVLEPKIPKPMRTTPGGQSGRRIHGKHNRTGFEIEQDEQAVMNVLSTGKPVLLRDIITYRNNRLGGNRWTNKNASGFMAHMMRKGLPIERLDYGRYRYTGGGTK